MKKFFAIAFIAAALVSCGGEEGTKTGGDTTTVAPTADTNTAAPAGDTAAAAPAGDTAAAAPAADTTKK